MGLHDDFFSNLKDLWRNNTLYFDTIYPGKVSNKKMSFIHKIILYDISYILYQYTGDVLDTSTRNSWKNIHKPDILYIDKYSIELGKILHNTSCYVEKENIINFFIDLLYVSFSIKDIMQDL